MITNILAALDNTTRAPAVLRFAAEIADRFDARLRLLRAITIPQDYPPAAHVTHDDPLPAYLSMEARTQLEELAAGYPRALREPPIIVVGPPARAILKTADAIGADLIVVGSHGFRGLDYLLGTVTERVASRSHHNVLVVHDG